MTLGLIFTILAVAGVALALAWNFIPGMKEKFKTYTTVLEAGGAFLYYALGQATGGIQDAVQAGYVPSWLVGYIPAIMLVWFLAKRFMTTAPVGSK